MAIRKGRKSNECLQEIKKILTKIGPATSTEIWILLSKGGTPPVSKNTCYNVLRDETCSEIGEIFKLEVPGMKYFFLERQGSMLIKRMAEDILRNKIKVSAAIDLLISHSQEINRILGLMLMDLPLVSLRVLYPAGGLQTSRPEIETHALGSRCDRSGPDVLPVENEELFDHIFDHKDIGTDLRGEWDSFKASMFAYETQKGHLYCTLDTILRERFKHVAEQLNVNASFTDSMYELVVTGDGLEDMENWKLVREGQLIHVARGKDIPTDGWLSILYSQPISETLVDRVNAEYQLIIEMVQREDLLAEGRAIIEQFNILADWRTRLSARIGHHKRYEMHSICPLVMKP